MALIPPDAPAAPSGRAKGDAPPRGLAALRHLLVEDEGGSAAVEFIVLIPVYILLMAALFSMAQVMHVRQEVVAAARYEAWSEGKGKQPAAGADAIKRAFFGIDTGSWESTIKEELDVPLEVTGGREATIAREVLANKVAGSNPTPTHPLRRVQVDAGYRWSGLSFLTGRELKISTAAAVILTNEHERPMFEDGQAKEHAMLSSQLGRSASQFDPIGESPGANPFFSPVKGLGQFADADRDPGIWSRDARLGGSNSRPGDVGSEHRQYQSNGLR